MFLSSVGTAHIIFKQDIYMYRSYGTQKNRSAWTRRIKIRRYKIDRSYGTMIGYISRFPTELPIKF